MAILKLLLEPGVFYEEDASEEGSTHASQRQPLSPSLQYRKTKKCYLSPVF